MTTRYQALTPMRCTLHSGSSVSARRGRSVVHPHPQLHFLPAGEESFHHLKGQNKKDVGQRPARFYMLDCVRNGDQRSSSIKPLDPLLEQFESEYHYLFARLIRGAVATRRWARRKLRAPEHGPAALRGFSCLSSARDIRRTLAENARDRVRRDEEGADPPSPAHTLARRRARRA